MAMKSEKPKSPKQSRYRYVATKDRYPSAEEFKGWGIYWDFERRAWVNYNPQKGMGE